MYFYQKTKHMRRLFYVHGLKRSGNHAIIGWLRAHARFIAWNDCIAIQPILSGMRTIPPPEDFRTWWRKKVLRRPRLLQLLSPTHAFIASMEDHELSIRLFHNVPCQTTNILILRDPFNLFSSRIRFASKVDKPFAFPRDSGPYMQRVVHLWKAHAREYLGLTDHLENKVCIFFNSWFTNENYRKSLSRDLQLKFTDRGFSRVAHNGGGSSFDGQNFDGNNTKMDVLNRKIHLTDKEKLLLNTILEDEELQDLNRRIIAMNQQREH